MTGVSSAKFDEDEEELSDASPVVPRAKTVASPASSAYTQLAPSPASPQANGGAVSSAPGANGASAAPSGPPYDHSLPVRSARSHLCTRASVLRGPQTLAYIAVASVAFVFTTCVS